MIRTALIEDNLMLLEALSRTLSAERDFEVVLEASTAEEARDFTAWSTTQVALVDLQLPDAFGLDLIETLSTRYPELLILVCTVHEDRATVLDAFKAGAAGYLLKRELESDLGVCQAIRQVVEGGAPLSPAVARWILEDFRSRREPEAVPGPSETLSSREVEVLRQLEEGLSYKEIATQLELSPHTVHAHVRNIHAKLRATERKQAVKRAKALGYLG